MMLSMKGIINVTGNTINVVGLQGHYGPPYANPYIIHSGKIISQGITMLFLLILQNIKMKAEIV